MLVYADSSGGFNGMKRTALIHLIWLACFALAACSSPEPADPPAADGGRGDAGERQRRGCDL